MDWHTRTFWEDFATHAWRVVLLGTVGWTLGVDVRTFALIAIMLVVIEGQQFALVEQQYRVKIFGAESYYRWARLHELIALALADNKWRGPGAPLDLTVDDLFRPLDIQVRATEDRILLKLGFKGGGAGLRLGTLLQAMLVRGAVLNSLEYERLHGAIAYWVEAQYDEDTEGVSEEVTG